MKRISVLTIGLAMIAAVPVEAQLFNFPNYAVPTGAPATFIGAGYGTGLNDASGKLDAYGAAVGRTGIGNRATVAASLGMIDSAPDSEWTFGGLVGFDVLPAGGSAQVTLQAGVGHMSPGDLTFLQFPIGVALKGLMEGPTANVEPWVMPRLHYSRVSANGSSASSTDFGVSGGFSVTLPSGLGVHTALDLTAVDPDNVWMLGVGLHYMIP
ncbi:MAG TPA: hypothetical protein VMM35_08875 [Longimicrobiales bacterium]|nr:hypothetical protein [Longimicrobiales bacterium]